jgi:hypothetical protein
MGVFDVVGWCIVSAATAWGVTLSWAKLALAHSRTRLQEEIRYWHAEAMRARDLAAQLKQEATTWSKAAQQGREDVIAIMPLLIAAQQRISSPPSPEMTLADMTENS